MISERQRKRFEKLRQGWDEANYSYIDVIISSGEIRKLFYDRCRQLEVKPLNVAMEAGIRPGTFKTQYIEKILPVATKRLNQQAFLKALEMVGIHIKVIVSTEDIELTEVKRKHRKQQIYERKNKKSS